MDNDRGPGFYKQLDDGTLDFGQWINGPGYNLEKPTDSADGWFWYPSEENAVNALSVPVLPPLQALTARAQSANSIPDLKQVIIDLLGLLAG